MTERNDLIHRLREGTQGTDITKSDAFLNSLMWEASVEIERLRAALAKIASYHAGSVDAGMSPWDAQAALNLENET